MARKKRSKNNNRKNNRKKRSSGRLPRVLKAAKKLVGKSNILADVKIKAMRPGKRISKSGRVYYERRANRADINPKKKL